MRIPYLSAALLLASPLLAAHAQEAPKALHLASLEWPPFASAALPNNGSTGAVIDAVARQMGSTVKVDYFAWKDTVTKGSGDPAYIGYFPVFVTEERARSCYFSGVIGKSSTGIGFLKEAPVNWKTVPDLASVKIGVVEAYANGDALDEAIRQGKQPVEVSTSDTNNVRKLVSKKLPAIVVDKAVLRFMTFNSAARDSVMFHDKVLLERNLHVCFQRTPAGKAALDAFDAALKKVDPGKVADAYLKALETK